MMKKINVLLALVLAVMLSFSACKGKDADNELYGEGNGTTVDTVETKTPTQPEETKFIFEAAKTTSKVAVVAPTKEDVEAARAAGTIKGKIVTSIGTIEVELYGDKAPITVANFVKLAKSGFYDGLIFHRVEPGFVIQGGDPSGNGTGGPGYSILREISKDLRHVEGALAMARSQIPDSAGSQFYITLAKTDFLDDAYAVFGKVTKGMDIVKKVKVGTKINSISFE